MDVESRLIARLRDLSGFEGTIEPSTEVSDDLRIEGDDLEDLLFWLQNEFGIDFSNLKAGDLNLNEPPAMIRSVFGKRRFKSLTVESLLNATNTKCWKPL
jgi:hypothetical protein